MKQALKVIVVLYVFSCSACTEPGETTGVAAATGGVIGAGLGAIIGNQTGDPGSGLVIGAAAGAASGAMVGNALEAQEKGIQAQDEAIERQERTIAAQRAELEELRKMSGDNVGFKRKLNANLKSNTVSENYAYNRAPLSSDSKASYSSGSSFKSSPSLKEKDLSDAVPVVKPSASGSYSASLFSDDKPVDYKPIKSSEPKSFEEPSAGNNPASLAVSTGVDSSECKQAAAEMSKANLAAESSDKLFHTRRAIRLCPQNPEYHNGLGEIYMTLKRMDDAKFEFQEALNASPDFEPAKRNMGLLNTKSADRY